MSYYQSDIYRKNQRKKDRYIRGSGDRVDNLGYGGSTYQTSNGQYGQFTGSNFRNEVDRDYRPVERPQITYATRNRSRLMDFERPSQREQDRGGYSQTSRQMNASPSYNSRYGTGGARKYNQGFSRTPFEEEQPRERNSYLMDSKSPYTGRNIGNIESSRLSKPSQAAPSLRNRTGRSGLMFHSRTQPINRGFQEREPIDEIEPEEQSRRGVRRQQELFKRNDPHSGIRRDTTAELQSRDTDLNTATDVGIRNVGNSCYVNSVFQLLRHCPSLTNLITKNKIIEAMNFTKGSQEDYKMTVLFNNAVNNLNKNNSEAAIQNINEIRKSLSKNQSMSNTNLFQTKDNSITQSNKTLRSS